MIQLKNGHGSAAREDRLRFHAQNITSSKSIEVDFERGLPAGQVARSVAGLMNLPEELTWQLRRADSAAFLREQDPIGEQLEPEARVVLTPQTRLGGRPSTGPAPLI